MGKSMIPTEIVASEAGQVHNLIQVFQYFNKATDEFKQAYQRLEERVAELNLELNEKNRRLRASLEEVSRLKNYQANILAEMSAGVVGTDEKGQIAIFNRAAEKLTGISAEEAVGKPYRSVFGVDIPVEQTPLAVLKSHRNVSTSEKQIVNREGKKIPTKFSISLIRGENGQILGTVELLEDLTEIKQLQREVQHARTVSALGEMAANVTHEIRNPLGAIGGFAALLERDIPPDDPRQRLVKKIIEGVGNLDKIIGNLLFVSRDVQPQLRKVPIKWIVNDVLGFLTADFHDVENKIVIEKKYPRQKIEAFVDPQLFQQMLLHVMKNSVQAMPEGGTLTVQLQKSHHKTFRVIVSDTGEGLPETMKDKLYFPFSSTKHKGTGLGLAIVRKIVELHRGTIQFHSAPRKGTTVILEFPIEG